MIDIILQIFWRAMLLMGLLYALDYALDGKLDLPHKRIEWEDLRIARWINRLIELIKSHVTHQKEETK